MQILLFIAAWLAGFWLVTTGLLRFGPRECHKRRVTTEPTEFRYGYAVSGSEQEVVRTYTDRECMQSFHLTHVFLRQEAVFLGLFWPVVVVIALPVAFIITFCRSMYRFSGVTSMWPGEVK